MKNLKHLQLGFVLGIFLLATSPAIAQRGHSNVRQVSARGTFIPASSYNNSFTYQLGRNASIHYYRNEQFFFSRGEFFINQGRRFYRVAPPRGLIIDRMPRRAVVHQYYRRTYFELNGVFFQEMGPGQFMVVDVPRFLLR